MEGNVKTEKVRFTVNALHILEYIAEETSAPGILFGVRIIYECLTRVAARAKQLHDAELDDLMNVMHLYDENEREVK